MSTDLLTLSLCTVQVLNPLGPGIEQPSIENCKYSLGNPAPQESCENLSVQTLNLAKHTIGIVETDKKPLSSEILTSFPEPIAPEQIESLNAKVDLQKLEENLDNLQTEIFNYSTKAKDLRITTQLTPSNLEKELEKIPLSQATNTNNDRHKTKSLAEKNSQFFNLQAQIETLPPEQNNQPSLDREVKDLESQLEDLQKRIYDGIQSRKGSPGFTIANPFGFGADGAGTNFGRAFISFSYQPTTRLGDDDDAAMSIGFSTGDATKSVGVQLSYTIASFGQNNRDFGSGGFNLKLHHRFERDFSVAIGWLGFANLGDDNEFEDSLYLVGTKIFKLQEDINQPFSRIAVTGGIGNGIFRGEKEIRENDDTVNVFGSLAFRIAKPVSLITEWTGQDLAVGVSIAPFANIPFVITPAVRDIVGDGDDPRFVLVTGFGLDF
jgi:hypothetical protein